ncbi:MAG TPA: Pycsar system effector family protein [Caulobacteraceae bacterium]|jgi:hypothetical protein
MADETLNQDEIAGDVAADRETQHDRFTEFEREVLQDNIALCDNKAGLLLAFTGALVIVSIEAIANVPAGTGPYAPAIGLTAKVLLLLGAGCFLASSHFSLTTVRPRIVRSRSDHIFWESPVFHLPVEEFVTALNTVAAETERAEQLRHLHLLAGICRSKYANFAMALRLGQTAFLALVAGELLRVIL